MNDRFSFDNIVMLTFIPKELLVLQKKESSGLEGGGTLPGLCHFLHVLLNHLRF